MTSQQTIDLHAHTLASDGSDTPLELVGAAAAAGIEVLAVTDHDTVEGLGQALAAGERAGVQVLPGCELTGVGYADALELAGGAALSRAHFARALVRRGAVADVAEAFDRYLSNGRPAYVPAPSLPVDEVVALVHAIGGVVVLAHPGRLAPPERERVVGAAVAAGVDGLEVWHSQHDDQARRRFMATAERHGLLATGGSDYHGRHKPGVRLGSGTGGNVLVPAYAADDLKERLAAAVRR